MKPDTITVEWLKKQGACSSMIERFSEVWPYGAEVNEENIRRAQQERFDLDWFASHYLTAQAYSAYDEALITADSAYLEAVNTADSAYQEAVNTAGSAYREAMNTADRAYDEAWIPVNRAYREAMIPARSAYQKAMANALIKIIAKELEGG